MILNWKPKFARKITSTLCRLSMLCLHIDVNREFPDHNEEWWWILVYRAGAKPRKTRAAREETSETSETTTHEAKVSTRRTLAFDRYSFKVEMKLSCLFLSTQS